MVDINTETLPCMELKMRLSYIAPNKQLNYKLIN
jgi:hypothetical protein